MVLRPTFWAFETAKRAITNSQLGLDTVGHNMTNSETPGYTRQRVDQVSWNVRGMSKYVINNQFYSGMGAVATGISQIRDPFLDARYRLESADTGNYAVMSSGLTDMANIFDEYDKKNGLMLGMSGENGLIESIRKASENPTDRSYSLVVRSKAEQFASMLNTYDARLKDAYDKNLQNLRISVTEDLNPKLSEISYLNEQIIKMEVYGNPANELRDRRNLLLDELSEYVDIDVTETATKIMDNIYVNRLTVTLRGSEGACGNPFTLVDHDSYSQFYVDDAAKLQLTDIYKNTKWDEFTNWESLSPRDANFPHLKPDFESVQDRTTGTATDLLTGSLKAYMDLLHGDGLNGNTRGLPYAQDYLDKLATQFANTLNNINNSHVGAYNEAQIHTNYNVGAQAIIDAAADPANPQPPVAYSDGTTNVPPAGNVLKDEYGNAILYITDGGTPPQFLDINGDVIMDSSDPPVAVTTITKDNKDVAQAVPVPNIFGTPGAADDARNYGLDLIASSQKDVYYYDTISNTYTTDLNLPNSVIDRDADGNILRYQVNAADPTLYDPYEITAADVAISGAWRDDETEILLSYVNNENADSRYLADFLNGLEKTEYNTIIPGEAKALTFHDNIVGFMAIIAGDKDMTGRLLGTSASVRTTIDDQRLSVSGVNDDEEAVDMMRYSNHYNAASRYMTALDDALDRVINGMGRVGL